MKWRKISEAEVESTIADPDKRQDSIKGRMKVFRTFGGRLIKVTYYLLRLPGLITAEDGLRSPGGLIAKLMRLIGPAVLSFPFFTMPSRMNPWLFETISP